MIREQILVKDLMEHDTIVGGSLDLADTEDAPAIVDAVLLPLSRGMRKPGDDPGWVVRLRLRRSGEQFDVVQDKDTLCWVQPRVICGTCGYRYPDFHPSGRCPKELDHPVMSDGDGHLVDSALRLDSETRAAISKLVNRAADDIRDRADLGHEGRMVDLLNLVVNVAITYIGNPGAELDDAIEANYDEGDLDEGETVVDRVLGWLDMD